MTRKVLLLLVAGSLVATIVGVAQGPSYPAGGEGGAAQPGYDQAQSADGAAPGEPVAAGIDYFHQELFPYGQWVVREGYGMIWVPRVESDWRPYSTGHWVYTDQGWAWVAHEPWGWAAFHYGRWFHDSQAGWAWVPGYTWAPAWVAWRAGGGYMGWAPLPPTVGFSFDGGLAFGGVVISPDSFMFVGERDILAPRLGGLILAPGQNEAIYRRAANVTGYTVVNHHIVNVGVSAQTIAQVTGRPVTPVPVASLAGAGPLGGHGAFYQPAVIARAAQALPGEFGRALHDQVAVQHGSRSFATVSQSKFYPPVVSTPSHLSGASGGGASRSETTSSVDSSARRTTGSSGNARSGKVPQGNAATTKQPQATARSTRSSQGNTGAGKPAQEKTGPNKPPQESSASSKPPASEGGSGSGKATQNGSPAKSPPKPTAAPKSTPPPSTPDAPKHKPPPLA
jgi:hypothetical protein